MTSIIISITLATRNSRKFGIILLLFSTIKFGIGINSLGYREILGYVLYLVAAILGIVRNEEGRRRPGIIGGLLSGADEALGWEERSEKLYKKKKVIAGIAITIVVLGLGAYASGVLNGPIHGSCHDGYHYNNGKCVSDDNKKSDHKDQGKKGSCDKGYHNKNGKCVHNKSKKQSKTEQSKTEQSKTEQSKVPEKKCQYGKMPDGTCYTQEP